MTNINELGDLSNQLKTIQVELQAKLQLIGNYLIDNNLLYDTRDSALTPLDCELKGDWLRIAYCVKHNYTDPDTGFRMDILRDKMAGFNFSIYIPAVYVQVEDYLDSLKKRFKETARIRQELMHPYQFTVVKVEANGTNTKSTIQDK